MTRKSSATHSELSPESSALDPNQRSTQELENTTKVKLARTVSALDRLAGQIEPEVRLSAYPGSATASNVMAALWEAAASDLSDDQLRWFSGATEMGQNALQNVRDMLESLAAAAAMDSEHAAAGRPVAGMFEGRSGAHVLASLAESLDAADALIGVGSDAAALLSAR